MLAGTLLFLGVHVYTYGQAGGECRLLEAADLDIVGKTGPRPDGQPDKTFALKLPAEPKKKIAHIELQTVTGFPGHWKTSPQGRKIGYIGVANAKTPSHLLNRKPGALDIALDKDADLVLYVTDDGHFSDKDRQYRVQVSFGAGNAWSAPVETKRSPPPEAAKPSTPGSYAVRMSAALRGLSRYDAVGPEKEIKGDNKADGLIVLSVQATDRVINGIQIRNTDGKTSVWDTVQSSPNSPVGVALTSDPTKLINSRDGAVSIPVKNSVDLNLYVADNGSIAEGKTQYRVTISFNDGEISWCPVERKGAETAGPQQRPTAPEAQVRFLATWLGWAKTDAVGKYPTIKSDGAADTVFGLDIEISPPAYITGIEVNSLDGRYASWGTGGTSQGNWGLAVAPQDDPTRLLNYPDGSISIPISRRSQFFLYAADPGDIRSSSQRLRMIIHLADGTSFQQFVGGPAATTPTVAPGPADPSRAMGIITCRFRGFIYDLVSPSKPGKDGYLDGTFILELKVEDKTISKVEITDDSGKIRWSTEGKGPAMFLGVASYPKIYSLINKGGPVNVQVKGRQTFNLYAADNGLLENPSSRFTVRVQFTDQTSLSTAVIK